MSLHVQQSWKSGKKQAQDGEAVVGSRVAEVGFAVALRRPNAVVPWLSAFKSWHSFIIRFFIKNIYLKSPITYIMKSFIVLLIGIISYLWSIVSLRICYLLYVLFKNLFYKVSFFYSITIIYELGFKLFTDSGFFLPRRRDDLYFKKSSNKDELKFFFF